MGQHADLDVERWGRFTFDQQILMIANEMHRASKLLDPADGDRRRRAYERTLALTDLTIRLPAHRAALRDLLRFTPTASRQIPHVDGGRPRPCP